MRKRAVITVLATTLALAGPALAGRPAFSFHGIEFAPAAERAPAAEAFLRDHAAPGTPLRSAIAAVEHADAHCDHQRRADGAIRCRYSAVASNSAADMPIGDVTWTVRLLPAADGTVAHATVTRERTGL